MKKLFLFLPLLFCLIPADYLHSQINPDTLKDGEWYFNDVKFNPYPYGAGKITGAGESLPCEIDVVCVDWWLTKDVKNGVFWFNYCTAWFPENKREDGRLMFFTANHVFPSSVNVGETVNLPVKFNYRASWCGETAQDVVGIEGSLDIKLLQRSNIADRVLCEFTNPGQLSFGIRFLGWDTRYWKINSNRMSSAGYPQGDIQKWVFLEKRAEPNNQYTYTKVLSGFGAVEGGYSGAPLVDDGKRVFGMITSGAIYACGNDIQSYVNVKNFGYDFEPFRPFLDQDNTGIDHLDGRDGVFPVELTSFTASVINNTVDLKWNTATEVNNYGFDVEKKLYSNWEKIGFVEGSGNSNSPKNYSFTDENPGTGSISYRLKQIDNDGSFEYSEVVEVIVSPKNYSLYQNYPNPFNPETKIEYSIPKKGHVTLKVYDILGKEVKTLVNEEKLPGKYESVFSAKNIPSGLYVYRLTSGNFTSVKKMMFVK